MVYGLSFWFGLAGSTELGAIGRALPDAPVGMVVVSTVLVGGRPGLQGLAGALPLLDAGRLRGRAAAGDGLPVRPAEGRRPRGARPCPAPGAARRRAQVADGDRHRRGRDHDARQPRGAVAVQRRPAAGLLLNRAGRLPAHGRGRHARLEAGLPALVYYLAAYAATNLAAFAVVLAVQRESAARTWRPSPASGGAIHGGRLRSCCPSCRC